MIASRIHWGTSYLDHAGFIGKYDSKRQLRPKLDCEYFYLGITILTGQLHFMKEP